MKQLEKIEHTFEPVFDENSRILILGTMPSPKSREQGFYYGHPRNRFWPVLAKVLNEPLPKTIEEKKEMVKRHGIALWDVLASCEIHGADDTSIRNPVPNDMRRITSQADIQAVFTTGGKATNLFKKYCEKSTGLVTVGLPSTSPANCRVSFDELVKAYSQILPAGKKLAPGVDKK